MPELIDRFETRSDIRIDLVLASTGNLAAQIEHGAPGDLFFSADQETVDLLADRGLVRNSTIRTYAVGALVMVRRSGVPRPASLTSLVSPDYGVIAIANPEHAPYGAAAKEALHRAGIWGIVEPRVVQGESIAQTYQLVQTGNADIGLVARSVAIGSDSSNLISVDPSLHAPIRQAAAVLEGSVHPHADAFLDFVMSAEGQSILADHGFGADQ